MYVIALACVRVKRLFYLLFLLSRLRKFCHTHKQKKRKWSDQPHHKNAKNRQKNADWKMKKKRFCKMKLRVCDRCEKKACSNEDEENVNFYFTVMGPCRCCCGCCCCFCYSLFLFRLFWAWFVLSSVVFFPQHTCSSYNEERQSKVVDKKTSNWLRMRIYIVIWGQSV